MSRRRKRAKLAHATKQARQSTVNVQRTTLRIKLLGASVFAAVIVAYIPTLTGGFIWDDDVYVVENVALTTFSGIGQIWLVPRSTPQYYPLVFTTFWCEYRLWGLAPLGYHLTNVILHALVALLLWRVLVKLSVPGAWLAAAIFALHPVHVESVAWITERKNVLSGVFYLSSLLAYLRFTGLDGAESPERRPLGAYVAALFLFVCALLSKTVTCSLPAAIALVLWWKRERVRAADILPLIPLFIVGIVFGLFTAWLEKEHVGAKGAAWDLSAVERCLLACRIPWFYLGKICWPTDLSFIYPRWQIDSSAWWQYLYPAASVALITTLWMLRRWMGKGFLAMGLFFGGTLFPAMGFFDVYMMRYSYVADHFQYLASIGPIAALAALGTLAGSKLRQRLLKRQPAAASSFAIRAAAPTLLLCALGYLVWQQGRTYDNLETLWRNTLAKNPTAWIAHNNLGNLLADRGETEEAIQHHRRALQLKPDHAFAHNNLASMLSETGNATEAIEHYERAVEIMPTLAVAHIGLGQELLRLNRTEDARRHFESAVRISADDPKAYLLLAATLVRQGKVNEAVGQLQQSLRLNPDDGAVHSAIGGILAEAGRFDEAIIHLRKSVKLAPNYPPAHNNLALALVSRGKLDEALIEYQKALSLEPRYADAHFNLANLLASQGAQTEAVREYRATLQIDPEYSQASQALKTLTTQWQEGGRH